VTTSRHDFSSLVSVHTNQRVSGQVEDGAMCKRINLSDSVMPKV
jgi:hypothetical protein